MYRWRYGRLNVGAKGPWRRYRCVGVVRGEIRLDQQGWEKVVIRGAKSEYVMLKSIVVATRTAQDELSAWMNLGEIVL